MNKFCTLQTGAVLKIQILAKESGGYLGLLCGESRAGKPLVITDIESDCENDILSLARDYVESQLPDPITYE